MTPRQPPDLTPVTPTPEWDPNNPEVEPAPSQIPNTTPEVEP